MEPGGLWWTDVEINKAERENDNLWEAAKAAGLADCEGGTPSMNPDDMSEEHSSPPCVNDLVC
jgi:hypothetical protein